MAIYGTLDGSIDLMTSSYPSIRPTLDLNFAQTKTLDPTVTFYRDSLATYVDSLGIIRTVPANVPRFDHDPTTGESLGLLIEESRTNVITHSSSTGAVNGIVGSGGSLPTGWVIDQLQPGTQIQVIGSGTEKGLTYVDIRVFGTTTGVNRTLIRPGSGISVTSGQIFYFTAYTKLVSGTNNLTHSNFDGAPINSTNELTRNTGASRTISSTGIFYARFDFGYNGIGVSYDVTFRLAAPQMEEGSFATSYIPTTASTVTRSADTAYMDGTNFSSWYNSSEGSFFIDAEYRGNSSVLFELQPIGSRTVLGSVGTNIAMINKAGSVTLTSNTPIVAGNYNKIAMTDKISDGVLIVNGQVIGTSNGTGIPSYTSLVIGNSFLSERMTGHIKRLMYYPKRLTNTQLQNITA